MEQRYFRTLVLVIIFVSQAGCQSSGILYPRDSESRQTKSLDGIWNFLSEPRGLNIGLEEEWYARPLEEVCRNLVADTLKPRAVMLNLSYYCLLTTLYSNIIFIFEMEDRRSGNDAGSKQLSGTVTTKRTSGTCWVGLV